MVIRVFDDEIVSATKFRVRQSHWLAVAAKRPVTVTNGDNKVTVFSRERIHELYLGKYYLELAVKFCNEMQKNEKSNIFPWIEYLDSEERIQFSQEFINAVSAAIVTDGWSKIEELLADWKATAETESDTEAMKALRNKVHKDKYVTIK